MTKQVPVVSLSRLQRWTLKGKRLGFGVAILMGLALPAVAHAQDSLGGHFGFVLPLVTRAGGNTIALWDQFSIGFPSGITVKTSDKVAFDLELVPTIQRTPLFVGLTVHPGILYTLPNDFVAGLRMAFDVNQASWGFTPLLHRKLSMMGSSALF
jgi:hypothetical protein